MNSSKNHEILVCVTAQESSKRLVQAGKELADKYNCKLKAVSVLHSDPDGNNIVPAVIQEIYDIVHFEGGDLTIYFNDEPVYTLIAHIGKVKPMTVVTGYPGEKSNNFIETLRLLIPSQEISMIDGDKIYTMSGAES